MRAKGAKSRAAIAALAREQHGVVTRAQLRAAGLSDSAVGRWHASGQLHRLHRGVYALGHTALSPLGHWQGAVLACGDGAVLSHLSAAGLWRLLDPVLAPVHVSLRGTGGRQRRARIRVHRRRDLPAADVVTRNRIVVTSVARTIADLEPVVRPAELRRAIRQAEVLGLATGTDPSPATRSELEDLFLALCRRHRLPPPAVNTRLGDIEVDFLWTGPRLIVETDGFRFHRGAAAFEHDHDRDLRLRAAGYEVLRFTYRQVATEPGAIAALIGRRLEKGG
jgi:very-short-patch-repair endonuclease